MEIKGKLRVVKVPVTYKSGFVKQEIVVVADHTSKYPRYITIEFLKDNVKLLEGLKPGMFVKVEANLGGSKWVSPEGVTKYFNSVVGWRLEKIEEEVSKAPDTDASAPTVESFDDLPF